MAFQKKTWKDRITEFPTRRTLTKSDGSTELVTVARAEGTVSQEGDAFNAASMNDLEERINQANNDLMDSLTASDNLQFKFGKDGDGNYGYYGADGSLIPFKKNGGITMRQIRLVRGTSAANWSTGISNIILSVEDYNTLSIGRIVFANQNMPTANYVQIINTKTSAVLANYQASSNYTAFSNKIVDISNASEINIVFASRLQTNEVDYTVLQNVIIS